MTRGYTFPHPPPFSYLAVGTYFHGDAGTGSSFPAVFGHVRGSSTWRNKDMRVSGGFCCIKQPRGLPPRGGGDHQTSSTQPSTELFVPSPFKARLKQEVLGPLLRWGKLRGATLLLWHGDNRDKGRQLFEQCMPRCGKPVLTRSPNSFPSGLVVSSPSRHLQGAALHRQLCSHQRAAPVFGAGPPQELPATPKHIQLQDLQGCC